MLVSWSWLKRYVDLPMTEPELVERLSMTGLNHEGTEEVGGEPVIELEVTSNRGDCLGHIGVAREISVLYDLPLTKPDPQPACGSGAVGDSVTVSNEFTEGCPRYTARVIRGVKIGPSPQWLVDALAKIGVNPVNNVVDITNFVLMECGQPLHAFDLAKLQGGQVVVRRAGEKETIEAIDHKTYELDPEMCVIADANRAIAVAGVMGGADTEVSEATSDLLIESAVFTPLSVRRTARKLKLQSPSSFRFERRVDPEGVDWASRRCCELILEIAGGTLDAGVIDTVPELSSREPITLRLGQISRVLGVDVPAEQVRKILSALGCVEQSADEQNIVTVAPSWRHDLTREVDLIEEVARIYGYELIPDDSPIPTTSSQRRPFDEAVEKIRGILVASGLSEAMTPSVVRSDVDALVSPWSALPPLTTQTAMLKGAKTIRRSIVPSLLSSRQANQNASGSDAELFEIAHIYVPPKDPDGLPEEQYCVAGVLSRDFFESKGVVESLVGRIGIEDALAVQSVDIDGFESGWAIELKLDGKIVGYLGKLCPKIQKQLKLERDTICFELALPVLLDAASLVPVYKSVSRFPSVSRDLNLIVDEAIRWSDLESSVRDAVGQELSDLKYLETYRDPQRDGQGKKRILLSMELQSSESTLTSLQADALRDKVVERCNQDHGAKLLG